MGVFEIMWKDGGGTGPLRRLAFEANGSGFAYIREQVSAWSDAAAAAGEDAANAVHRRSASMGDAVPLLRQLNLHGGTAAGGGGGRAGGEESGSSDGNSNDAVVGEGSREIRRTQSDANPGGLRGGSGGGDSEEEGDNDSNGCGGGGGGGRGASTAVALSPGPHAPSLSEYSAILSSDQVRSIVSALPARCRLCNWRLAYSSRRDGISLRSLYRAAAGKNSSVESVLVVRDTKGHSFGAFTSEPWRVSPRYYGTGESFVFTVEPKCVAYRWSTKNDYFQFGRGNCVAIGGGGSGFALWLDEELLRGNTAVSDTFDNELLASETEFEIVYVELWTFEPS